MRSLWRELIRKADTMSPKFYFHMRRTKAKDKHKLDERLVIFDLKSYWLTQGDHRIRMNEKRSRTEIMLYKKSSLNSIVRTLCIRDSMHSFILSQCGDVRIGEIWENLEMHIYSKINSLTRDCNLMQLTSKINSESNTIILLLFKAIHKKGTHLLIAENY